MTVPAPIVRAMPYLKFICSLVAVVLGAIAIPLGSPVWVPVVIMAANAVGVFALRNSEPTASASASVEMPAYGDTDVPEEEVKPVPEAAPTAA